MRRLLVCTLLLAPLQAQAAEDARPELQPDRPGLADAPGVVGRGLFEIEAGVTFEHRHFYPHSYYYIGTETEQTLSAPNTLLRYGLANRLEVRFGGDGFVTQSVRSLENRWRDSGFSDVAVGMKVRLVQEKSPSFDLSVLPSVSIPIGARAFTSDGIDPALELLWYRGYPRDLELSGSFNVASLSQSEGRGTEMSATISLDHPLRRSLNGFVELFGGFEPREDYGNTHSLILDGGLTLGLGADTQLDLSAGHSFRGLDSLWFIGAGVARRL